MSIEGEISFDCFSQQGATSGLSALLWDLLFWFLAALFRLILDGCVSVPAMPQAESLRGAQIPCQGVLRTKGRLQTQRLQMLGSMGCHGHR